jgi:hypothetical protein
MEPRVYPTLHPKQKEVLCWHDLSQLCEPHCRLHRLMLELKQLVVLQLMM